MLFASLRSASRLPLQAGGSPGLPFCFCKLHQVCSREFARCLVPALLQGRKLHRGCSCNTLWCFAVAFLSSRLRGQFIAVTFCDWQKPQHHGCFSRVCGIIAIVFRDSQGHVVAFASPWHRCNCICNLLSSSWLLRAGKFVSLAFVSSQASLLSLLRYCEMYCTCC